VVSVKNVGLYAPHSFPYSGGKVMGKVLVYYKRNVAHTVVVRRNAVDTLGVSLNNASPWVALEEDDVRDFKIANKKLIMEGLSFRQTHLMLIGKLLTH
jgi:hypothetical protein